MRSSILRFATLVLMAAFASHVGAALPVVDRIQPLGIQRGETVKITFHGQRIGDAYQVLSDHPGVEVVAVEAIDNKKTDVTIAVSPDITPGLYPLRLVTKTGVANLRLLAVGTLPVVNELEPNSQVEQAQTIDLNTTVEGMITNEDQDFFQVDLKAGQRLVVEVEGIRLGYGLRNRNILDPFVAILDEDEFELASSDDSSLFRQDGLCTFTAKTEGRYTILIRDSSFRGSNLSGYRLHVGDFPRPVAIFPAGGQPGSILDGHWIDVDGSRHAFQLQLPSLPDDQHAVAIETTGGMAPSPNFLRINDLPVVIETEPNDDYRKAEVATIPAAFCGIIDQDGDFDCFSFDCKKGRKYRVEVFARKTLRSDLDAVLNVFGPDNKTIQSSDDVSGQMDPFLEFTAKADGKHTARIYDHLRRGGPLKQYRIEVTQSVPSIDLTFKELRRDEATPALVPVGASGAIMVTAKRNGFGGPIDFDLLDLPPGVSAQTFPIPQNRAEIPIFLTAGDDAVVGCSLIDVIGKPTGEAPLGLAGQFSQTHKLVLGRNRRHMWSHQTERAVCAVTDPVPFDIELVQPKTPIVRQGSKQLVVKLKRDEGFEGDVSLRTLYNPPGIGINNSRRLKKGQTEVTIPITANGGAAIGRWPLIINAYYNSPTGQRVVATAPVQVDVQSQYFKYSFPKAAGELGQELSVAVAVEVLREFDEQAEVQLVGLPKGVTSPAPVQPLSKGTTKVTFPVSIADDAKVGTHKTLVCVSRIRRDGETITQTVGTGELRIDKPIAAAEPAAKKSKPKPAEKPLSRLEQLRLQKSDNKP